MEKPQFVNKHIKLNIPETEIERKWRLYEEEQEQMKILMGISAPGNAWAQPFISTWKTDNTSTGSSNNNQVRLPLMPNGDYNFLVNWGDNSINTITSWNQAETTHTYAAIGTYTITITGYINGWSFASISPATGATGDRLKLLTITQWGCLRFNSIITDPLVNSGAFYNCTNLTLLTVSDTPNFKGSPSTFNFFRGCTALTTINNINSWDVSGVTFFRNMFRECPTFNDNVGNWNMRNAISISGMFYSTSNALFGNFTNGGSASIGNWDVSNVTDMSVLFAYQRYFNHDLGNWNVSNVVNMAATFFGVATFGIGGTFNNGGSDSIKNWNMSKVVNIAQMFAFQPLFNQEVGLWDVSNVTAANQFIYCTNVGSDSGTFTNGGSSSLSNWNTSKFTRMDAMFGGQPLFNINLGSWDTSKVTNMGYMFQCLNFNNGGSNSINNWDVSKVTNMSRMFQHAWSFDQPLNNWNVSLVTDFINFMSDSGLPNAYSVTNYSNLLIGWASRPVKPNISINFSTNKYNSTAVAARAILTSAPNNWTIADGGLLP